MTRNKLIPFLKIKGIILFLFFIFMPFLLIYIRENFIRQNFFVEYKALNLLLNDNVFFMFINYSIFFVILGLLFLIFKKKAVAFISRENWLTSMEKSIFSAIKAFGIGFLVTIFIFAVVDKIPGIVSIKRMLSSPNDAFVVLFDSIRDENHFKVIFLFFLIIIVGPVYEEILFRGFLQEGIQRLIKKEIYVITIVALIFSIPHLPSLSNMIFAFIVGIFLSKKRKENGNINTSIWIHSIINFTGLLTGIIYKYLENLKLF